MRENEGDLTQSYDGSPYTNRKLNNQLTSQKRDQYYETKNIEDRLRTVSWCTTAIQLV